MNGMFMTGNGTEENPYLVEDVYDFCAITNDTDKEVTYYKLDTNIDFNDHETYKQGLKGEAVVNANKSVLDGNGKEIRNIVAYNTPSVGSILFTFKEINNCKFANLVNFLSSRFLFKSGFKRCSFYIMTANANFSRVFKADSSGHCEFYECTLTLSGSANDLDFGSFYNTYNRCKIIFKDLSAKMATAGSSTYISTTYLINGGQFDHTYFLGKIDTVYPLNNAGSRYIFNSGLTNVYFAVECDLSGGSESFATTYVNYVNFNGTKATSFVDKNLLSNANPKDSGLEYFLSTEECKSTSELIKIGFPVIGL